MEVSLSTILKMEPSGRTVALSEIGFYDGRLASQNIDDLQRFSYLSGELHHIIGAALNSPDPDSALSYLERFCAAAGDAGIDITPLLEHLPLFIKLFGSSEFLSSILIRKPERGLELINSPYLQKEKPLSLMKTELEEIAANISDYNGLLSALRPYKQEEMLRIGARDLLGYGTMEDITSELSSLASAALDTAYIFCLSLLKRDYGMPYCRDESGNMTECTFVVLGMGKLGGNELNFSSDIDLIYLYTSDEGETFYTLPPHLNPPPQRGEEIKEGEGRACPESRSFLRQARPEPAVVLRQAQDERMGRRAQDERHRRGGGKTIYEFYCKLAELLTKAISSNTEDGFVFRVDLRLRPDGQNGPIVNSLNSAETYYESWGETWERSAMLKARPVAGDISLGERFLKDIEPFMYRKYLDFSTIEDIKEMKLKIDRELALKPGMWDVKLGSGGIREIEFLVQAIQLINAGRDRSIRDKNTLKSLRKLGEKGLLSNEDCEILVAAYRFLRTVEHRIQVENERKTHMLPAKPDGLNKLAKRCGFKGLEGFSGALTFHSANVERLYDGIFHEPSKRLEDIPANIACIFLEGADKNGVMKRLGSMGFEEPETTYGRLQILRDATPSTRLIQRDRKALRKLAPHLFMEASKSSDPDMALANLDRFLNAVGARGSFYSLLIENPNIARFLVALFGASDFLSQFLIGHPELLDTLLRADTVTPVKDKEELKAELTSVLSKAEGYEELLDAIRGFRNTELIRIGINDISGEIELQDVCGQLTSLAELSVEEALRISEREITARFGAPFSEEKEAVMSVIGMGRLGGGEMNYSSDLDMIFIYSGAGKTRGPRVITNQEYFAKVAQRVISFLTLQTREGYLYKVDTRLRPSGSAGALVSSLDAFRRYHRESARLWERQALIKARAIAGSMKLGKMVIEDIESFVYGRDIGEEGRKEMVHLRERMEKELAKEGPEIYNIKTGRGGIVDIEFAVQFLQLGRGKGLAGLRRPKTLDALNALLEAGLITSADYSVLREAYLFLMKAENRLRILHNISTDQMELETGKIVKLARRLGYQGKGSEGPEALFLSDYRRHTEKVRERYNRLLLQSAK